MTILKNGNYHFMAAAVEVGCRYIAISGCNFVGSYCSVFGGDIFGEILSLHLLKSSKEGFQLDNGNSWRPEASQVNGLSLRGSRIADHEFNMYYRLYIMKL